MFSPKRIVSRDGHFMILNCFEFVLWNYLPILKILPVTLFLKRRFFILKMFSAGTRCSFEIYRKPPRKCTFTRIFPASNVGWMLEKLDQRQRGKPVQKYRFGGMMARCLFIFHIFITFIHSITFIKYIDPSPFAGVSLHLFIARKLSGKYLPVVPRRESNSCLPYSKPTCYQLSYAAPWTEPRRTITELRRTMNWATPHHNWATPHHNWATPHHQLSHAAP